MQLSCSFEDGLKDDEWFVEVFVQEIWEEIFPPTDVGIEEDIMELLGEFWGLLSLAGQFNALIFAPFSNVEAHIPDSGAKLLFSDFMLLCI